MFLIALYDKHFIFQFNFYFIWQKQQDTNESKIYSRKPANIRLSIKVSDRQSILMRLIISSVSIMFIVGLF